MAATYEYTETTPVPITPPAVPTTIPVTIPLGVGHLTSEESE